MRHSSFALTERQTALVTRRTVFLRLDEALEPAYSDCAMGSWRYTTEGPRRGRCGHQHKSIPSALECLDADEAWCQQRGQHTDRRIFALGNRQRRELDDEERALVAACRAAPKPQ